MLMLRSDAMRLLALSLIVSSFATIDPSTARAEEEEDGWVTLFDGETLKGWKVNENEETWKVVDGAIVCHGERSHLFYVGDDEPFVNFEFKADVMTTPGSNSGIYFHTRYQDEGFPKYGHETQVNISHTDPKRTGSLYGVVDVTDPPAKDNEFWTQHIIVQGRHIIVKINGETVVDYEEPEGKAPYSEKFERLLGKGTFALQGHDPGSEAHFKNIKVKRLP
jgi:hypothetical protein